jgi:hypothetical protein
MKRWTATWTALVVAGFLVVSGTGFAQTPAPPTAPATTTQVKAEQGTPQEHLERADAALKSISPAAASGKAKSQISELKKRVNALQKLTANNPSGAAAAPTGAKTEKADAKGASKWAAEAAAADKILGELLADTSATGAASATTPIGSNPTGTTGTSPSKATGAVTLDEETKAQLTTARASLTAFASAMSGSAPPPPATTSPSAQPAAASTASPAAATPTAEPATPASPTTPPPTQPATPPAAPAPSPQPTTQPPTQPAEPATPASPTTPPPTQPATPPAAQPPTQPAEPATPAQPLASTTQAPTDPAAAQPKPDADGAKRALTAARDSLGEVTKLPAAQQLSGEPRTQLTQLIANFNELITTNTEWKASYAKVDANLTALMGAQTADESTTAPAAATAGATSTAGATTSAAGAVGTSGTTTTTLDPGVKAKLAEFRAHLKEFEKAANGSGQK